MKSNSMRLTRLQVVGVLLLAATMGFGWQHVQTLIPHYVTGQGVPDAKIAGSPEGALEHSRKLLDLCRKANWNVNPVTIPWEMMLLPDRKFAENPSLRGDKISSFVFPKPDVTPWYKDVAFFTTLYVRQNTSRYAAGVTRSRPNGFYIVAWKNGAIETVPVDEVRVSPTSDGRELITVFPGMAEYDPNGRKLPFVENAAPPDSQVLVALGKHLAKEHKHGDSNAPCRRDHNSPTK